MNKPLGDIVEDKRKHNKGRPLKLTVLDKRIVIQQVKFMRNTYRYFTIKRVMMSAGLSKTVSNEIIHRSDIC